MPSSDPTTILPVLKLVEAIRPMSILDVGCGNGRYGFLFRETLDLNYGRLIQPEWEVVIDGIESENDYVTMVHHSVYNVVHVADWLKYEPNRKYDLVFMGDVLEHFPEGDWQKALQKAKDCGSYVIVVCPNGLSEQGAWMGHESEIHRVTLDPAKVGGKCVFANSKCFINGFSNNGKDIFTNKRLIS